MRNINELLKQLIPPSNYEHRNGFSNESIVLSLSEQEKQEVEQNLIKMLDKNDDPLIGETLAIMKSKDSLPILKKRLDLSKKVIMKILWASYINEIKGGDNEMKEVALRVFDNTLGKYSLIEVFHPLSRFGDARINDKIRDYIDHKDYLIAYNARICLGISVKELIERERAKNSTESKKWWKFWK